jgi:hypothetical protein
LEKLHVPTVYLTTSNFLKGARLSAEDNSVPKLRIIALPSETYYTDGRDKERAIQVVRKHFDEIIDALVRPLTPEETDTAAKAPPKRENVKVTGSSYAVALENFNDMFLENHWSDGLPIIPPTPERVKRMLTGTDRSPDEIIGVIYPRKGIATVEGIAINAVMAGAKPDYLPVIIAAIEGLLDKDFDHQHFLTSTGSFNLVITISGPIVEKIGINSGIGVLSYGNRANSAIGRSVRMAMINLGQLWPKENDMALIGRANPHTFIVIAENEKENPWDPYHVSQGFKATDSCVSVDVVYGHTYGLGSPNVHGGGAVALTTPEMIINAVLREIAGDRQYGNYRGPTGFQRHLIILNPEIAQEMKSRLGMSREDLIQQLYDQSSIPFEQLSKSDIDRIRNDIKSGSLPKDREAALKSGGRLPVLYSPEDLHVIVAGGIPGYSMTMIGYRRGLMMDNQRLVHNTKLIRGVTLAK